MGMGIDFTMVHACAALMNFERPYKAQQLSKYLYSFGPGEFYHSCKTNSFSFPKFGEPRPVTGSHPLVALNPEVPQPELFPVVISLSTPDSLEHKRGFKNPKGDLPFESRAAFKSEMILANVGVAADVPATLPARRKHTITTVTG